MEDFYRILVERLEEAVLVLDGAGRIKFANPAAERILALRSGASTGRLFHDFVLQQDRPLFQEVFSSPGAQAEGTEPLVRLLSSDGALRHSLLRVTDLRGEPSVDGVMVEVCDVGAMEEMRRELEWKEEELREFRTIVETANYGVVITDTDGYILYVNPHFATLHGYGTRDLLGKNMQVLHPPERREKLRGLRSCLLEKGSCSNLEIEHAHRGGSLLPLLMNAVVIRDDEGSPLYIAATTMDIRERKRWEEEREAYRHRLEEMVEERTRELSEANRRLQEEVEERSRVEEELRLRNLELDSFALSVAHDLRGNISVIEGFARTALSAGESGEHELVVECLKGIAEGARRMERFVECLLAYARAGHPQEAHMGTELDSVVREVQETLEEEMNRAGARLEIVGPLPEVLADRVLLYQVIYNLVSNALKFCPAERDPHVQLGCRPEGGRAVVWVRDNGIGIAPEDLESIFVPFSRVGEHPSSGMGVGLATVRRAVENWGGKIWVESTPGEGSTFFFTVPLS